MCFHFLATPRRALSFLLLLGLGFSEPVAGQAISLPPGTADPSSPDSVGFFYHGLSYGSEAYLGPLDVLLNKGFAKTQISHHPREIFDASYAFPAVWDALIHPARSIERSGGWKKLLTDEILPITFDSSDLTDLSWDAYPNYAGHLLEGGIVYRRLTEWFQARDVPAPALLAGVTNLAASILNEAYENHGAQEGTGPMVADLYLFDIGGMFLFSSDRVARFFANRLRATVWTGQASITLPALTLVNNGNHLILKPPLPFLPNTSFFFRTGLGLHLGLTLHRPEGLDLSFGVGSETEAQRVHPETGEISLEVDPSAAIYVDRHNSLLASLAWSEREDRLLSLNVFPGVVDIRGMRPGLWVVLTASGDLQLGITASGWWGAGIGFAR